MTTLTVIQPDQLETLIERAVSKAIFSLQSKTEKPETKQQEGSIDFAVEICRNLKKSTIYKFVHEKRMPFKKRGKNLWFNRSELEAWIEAGMPDFSKQQAAEHLAAIVAKRK
jgi:excisionase family DNA binding protein